jgi:hypothetical protein
LKPPSPNAWGLFCVCCTRVLCIASILHHIPRRFGRKQPSGIRASGARGRRHALDPRAGIQGLGWLPDIHVKGSDRRQARRSPGRKQQRYVKFHRWYNCKKYQLVKIPFPLHVLRTLRSYCRTQAPCNLLICWHLPRGYETLRTFVASDPISTGGLGALAHWPSPSGLIGQSRVGAPPCNSPPAISIMYPPSCDVPLRQGSPTHSCPGPWRLGRFFFPVRYTRTGTLYA